MLTYAKKAKKKKFPSVREYDTFSKSFDNFFPER